MGILGALGSNPSSLPLGQPVAPPVAAPVGMPAPAWASGPTADQMKAREAEMRRVRMAGLSQLFGSLAVGQAPDVSASAKALAEMRERGQATLGNSRTNGQQTWQMAQMLGLSPEQMRVLAMMPEQAATEVILGLAGAKFQPPAPTQFEIMDVNGDGVMEYVDPTGRIDARQVVPNAQPAPGFRILSPEEVVQNGLDPAKVWQQSMRGDDRGRIVEVGGSGVTVNVGGQNSTFYEALDKAFAPEFIAWQNTGADAVKQIDTLEGVLAQLESGERLTGPVLGMAPDMVQTLFAPEALDARQRVEEVVQRNLRTILGAQFTEKEGERLIARAYNQSLRPEQNAARLRALVAQMRAAAQAKQAMVEYVKKNGTLYGYDGPQPSVGMFDAALDQMDARQGVSRPGTSGNVLTYDPETGGFK